MALTRPSLDPQYAGWTSEDFLCGILAQLVKLNARHMGIAPHLIDGTGEDTQVLREVMRGSGDLAKQQIRGARSSAEIIADRAAAKAAAEAQVTEGEPT